MLTPAPKAKALSASAQAEQAEEERRIAEAAYFVVTRNNQFRAGNTRIKRTEVATLAEAIDIRAGDPQTLVYAIGHNTHSWPISRERLQAAKGD